MTGSNPVQGSSVLKLADCLECFPLHCLEFYMYIHDSILICIIIVVNAEVVDISNVSDITFPTSSDELDNFTVVEMDDSAQITIPAGAITKLSAGNSSAG